VPEEKSHMESKGNNKIKWFSLLRILGIIIFIIVLFNVDLAAIWVHIKSLRVELENS